MDKEAWPVRIRLLREKKCLEMTFEDGAQFLLPAEYLRVESPSAEVQGHMVSQKILQSGKKNVEIAQIERVGNYAVRLFFDDGHDTGIYSWQYLYELGADYESRWKVYLKSLSDKGLSR